ncbi:hypothetical protein RSOLAG1IB_01359 [Rhizoctonia solani AG-1 IB]|uniref:Ankyrin repeats (3 copies) domain-containing protein n=1 Tax=Thanatephorus cucumeris (strain AG1-IB / isolate 7/3/14) TaxID=1108050 RepID=A0A0B7FEI1_THACB|nr:hypothetical protein RSOLAG1IB_01359 [Rhizoctonia solani AG-1 IB]
MHVRQTGLLDLPAELLFEILAYSTSAYLPLANKHLLHTFHHAPPSCRAYFILGRIEHPAPLAPELIIQTALSYPICTETVLDFLEHTSPLAMLSQSRIKAVRVSPGRWLFRNLPRQVKLKRRRKHSSSSAPVPVFSSSISSRINPLAFLESLERRYTLAFSPPGSAFALAMCVRAGPAQYPLLQVLLRTGADPGAKSCLPLQIAAASGDLDALKLMIEPSPDQQAQGATGGKRRRVEDRVQPTTKVLLEAVKGKHIEVAEWLMHEKGIIPDMATMRMIQNA